MLDYSFFTTSTHIAKEMVAIAKISSLCKKHGIYQVIGVVHDGKGAYEYYNLKELTEGDGDDDDDDDGDNDCAPAASLEGSDDPSICILNQSKMNTS